MSRTWIAVAGAPRSTMAPQCARRSSGVISVSSLVRHLGSSSRSKIDRRIARVLSAIGAAVSHFSPNSPKLLASRSRRFSRCFSIAGDRPSCQNLFFLQLVRSKKRPSESAHTLTVSDEIGFRNGGAHRQGVRQRRSLPADNPERLWIILFCLSVCYGGFRDAVGYPRMGQNHSHSIVPGGFEVTS
jgi:hypothetical protein